MSPDSEKTKMEKGMMIESGCLFCTSKGPFSTIEHIVPESLGNRDFVIEGQVCDGCQSYFGKEVERHVLSKTPFGVWRVLLGIPTKKGKPPTIDLSQPKTEKGILPSCSIHHDDGIGFACNLDGSISVDIDNDDIVREIVAGERNQFRFVLSPEHLAMIGRFLGKIALEAYCLRSPDGARAVQFDALRHYVRYGVRQELWPLFHDVLYTPSEFQGALSCGSLPFWEGRISETPDNYVLFSFRLGPERWSLCMNVQFPTTDIPELMADFRERCIWYPSSSWGRST